jgi:hypothetical protein
VRTTLFWNNPHQLRWNNPHQLRWNNPHQLRWNNPHQVRWNNPHQLRSKPDNYLKVFGSKKTKWPKQDTQSRLEGGEP